MSWIESHQSLRNHPKLTELCRAVGASPVHMTGHLHWLWWWCMDYALDGDITRYNESQIAAGAGWGGDAVIFVNSLVASGFLDRDGDTLRIHDWMEFCGEIILKRLRRKAERKETAENGKKSLPKAAGKSDPAPAHGFETVWERYPSKSGRKAAQRHYVASVKTMTAFIDIQKALDNYLKCERVRKGFIQNGSTWFNDWQGWIAPTREMMGEQARILMPTKLRTPDPQESELPTPEDIKKAKAEAGL